LTPTVCQETCGDGILITALLECDDGNTENGDGCSETCTIESNFVCSGGTSSTPDVCTSINVEFSAFILNS
jgi:cysteine-rich repeat protein